MIDGFIFFHQSRFYRVTCRGVRYRLVFQLAALARDQCGGIARMIRANRVVIDLDSDDGGGGAETLFQYAGIAFLQAVEDRVPKGQVLSR